MVGTTVQKTPEMKTQRTLHKIGELKLVKPLVECIRHPSKALSSVALAGAITAGALSLPFAAKAQDPWANLRFGYSPDQQYSTVTMEGGAAITERLKFYGFAELDATKEAPLDVSKSAFVKLRLMESLGANLHLIGEYLDATGTTGRGRFGLAFTPTFGKGNFTMFAVFPADTSGEKGVQLFAFTSQQISKRVYAQLTVDHACKPRTTYIEPELNIEIVKNLAAMLQGRIFVSPDGTSKAVVVGLKYSF